ncbi:TCR/Tet family MFS transporter [Stenotrophobium rhamnosiphilum]|uniref:Tetracycline resistance MFS efflux pump n=1 Tax=Stenotrophobium rhamnosiphilum TaxID=2029166 RepID=A0A2T5MH36_9GAMM|nr:TCR/Tet family MFS transporter [Stenotrophobium rhamnosiphilum]PTU31894.1 tetracycline resistance MFS efflux pump [Stenotrophobium rhamnosiphilum]
MSNISAAPRAAVIFIFITVCIDIISFGIIIPVLPHLVTTFAGGDIAHGARVYGVFTTVWALMQFFSSPILGALSDRFGRRPVILLSCVGMGLDFILMAMAPNLAWLFVGRMISGITAANFSTASAYIADVTSPDKRAAAFGMLGVAFGIGFVIGPAIGGLLGSIDPHLPFWAGAVLALINAAYGYFVLPESLAPEHRSAFSWRKANPLGALKLLRVHPELMSMASINFLSQLAQSVYSTVIVLYMGYRYSWDAGQIGMTLALVGVCSAIVQGGLTGPVVRYFGERHALLFSLLIGIAGFVIFGLSSTGILFLCGIPVIALSGFANPAVQSLMTQRVLPSEQGLLQGANAALIGITGMIGPILFSETYARFIDPDNTVHLPGAPFLLAAVLMTVAAFIAWRAVRVNSAR